MAVRVTKGIIGALLLLLMVAVGFEEDAACLWMLAGGAACGWLSGRPGGKQYVAKYLFASGWMGAILGMLVLLVLTLFSATSTSGMTGANDLQVGAYLLGAAVGKGLVGGIFVGVGLALFVPAMQGPPTKECPFCAERILEKAKVCKHCGRDLQNAEPADSTVRPTK